MERGAALALSVALLAAVPAAAQDDGTGNAGWDEGFGDDWGDPWAEEPSAGMPLSGFVESAGGSRWSEDPQVGRHGTLGELRLRLETEWRDGGLGVAFKGDGLYDGIDEDIELVMRDLSLSGSPLDDVDVRAGRQVLTWGTGDLLFLNDLFPKDFISFFAGREDEYLKAPSDTLRATAYGGAVNVDLAWTPFFTPDEYLRGARFSFFFPPAGELVAPDPPFGAERPDRDFANGEFALRLFRTVRGVEYALYGYRGFFKQPSDFRDFAEPRFAPLTALGASLRRPLAGGLWNAEFSYYASRDDRAGTDPFVPNDQLRVLTGFEKEWFTRFNVGLQYYLEWTRDHDALLDNSPWPEFEPEEYRHLVTTRLTYRTPRDTWTWSLFAFVSPSDRDYHLRPSVDWRFSDAWNFTAGANLFGGEDPFTFFGQLEDNSNAYFRARYNF